MSKTTGRDPGATVKAILGSEVGFVCPVANCSSPYLEWHHFDPPWREQNHHNPEGMIALCREHHIQADHGAYTKDQLRRLKKHGVAKSKALAGEFQYRREAFVAIVGGNYYFNINVIIQVLDFPVIWFTRSKEGEQLLNLRLPTISGEKRLAIENNFWVEFGSPTEFECPPGGKKLRAKYSNGDEIAVKFSLVANMTQATKLAPGLFDGREIDLSAHGMGIHRIPPMAQGILNIPFTAVEVSLNVDGTPFQLEPHQTVLAGNNVVAGGFFSNGNVGIQLGNPSARS